MGGVGHVNLAHRIDLEKTRDDARHDGSRYRVNAADKSQRRRAQGEGCGKPCQPDDPSKAPAVKAEDPDLDQDLKGQQHHPSIRLCDCERKLCVAEIEGARATITMMHASRRNPFRSRGTRRADRRCRVQTSRRLCGVQLSSAC